MFVKFPDQGARETPVSATKEIGVRVCWLAPWIFVLSGPGGGAPRLLSPGSRLLVIGDSHTAGHFGDELDRQLRARGLEVHTVGSSGATAEHYLSGKGTRVGFADHALDGRVEKTLCHETPRLETLIASDHPDLIVVALGANFRWASPEEMALQVGGLGEIAKRHHLPLIWVGPPHTRQDAEDPHSLEDFDERMELVVKPYGTYFSSAPLTPEYAGTDGVHYNGDSGKALAGKWAQGLLETVFVDYRGGD